MVTKTHSFSHPLTAVLLEAKPTISSSSATHVHAGGNGLELHFRELPDAYHFLADMPGLDPEEVTIDLHKQVLAIVGTNKPQPITATEQLTDQHSGDDGQTRPDRTPANTPTRKANDDHPLLRYRHYKGSVKIPSDVDEEKISASMEKGVLNVRLPKRNADKLSPRAIIVQGPPHKKSRESN
mmetsp:Transcript_28845/g.81252  ORF Transcript_28845/g.81252 Transcript_28845/m.81252 type:complete len:182 (+) Transcript_28845:111-656(+)|eukprot:CAMPEP_0117692286 /NCGR_PEP_ID=MMETSP0804-20121206/26239_1 /TAXON_ID=1074897 /ORGANISM="Tetraselmis astigmatica, Strain CCMP880" /LENGTH=181 /DNA_ID=CAMNT_0005505709 /DNA_START=112 /DNA_END=657 /DNA_ORIENTATION=+